MSHPLPARILLACSRPSAHRETLSTLLRDPALDWNPLYRMADRHKMVGIAAPLLQEALGTPLPETPDAPWQSRWRSLAARELSQRAALGEIALALDKNSVPFLLIKGFSVHLQAYPAGAVRGASDVDLLVKPQDLPSAVRCLGRIGFVSCATDPRGRPVSDWAWLLRRRSEATFRRPAGGVAVDLHWALCSPIEERISGIRLARSLWENSRALAVDGTPCPIPGLEEEILLISFHLLKGGPFHLRGLSDLLRLVRLSPPPRRDRLERLARETGAAALVFHALELLRALSPDEVVPSSIRSALRPFSPLRPLLSPSLRLHRLMETQGTEWTNWGLRWRGVFFARRPWVWAPYQLALHGKSALRSIGLC